MKSINWELTVNGTVVDMLAGFNVVALDVQIEGPVDLVMQDGVK